jgi:hypothetical protein
MKNNIKLLRKPFSSSSSSFFQVIQIFFLYMFTVYVYIERKKQKEFFVILQPHTLLYRVVAWVIFKKEGDRRSVTVRGCENKGKWQEKIWHVCDFFMLN